MVAGRCRSRSPRRGRRSRDRRRTPRRGRARRASRHRGYAGARHRRADGPCRQLSRSRGRLAARAKVGLEAARGHVARARALEHGEASGAAVSDVEERRHRRSAAAARLRRGDGRRARDALEQAQLAEPAARSERGEPPWRVARTDQRRCRGAARTARPPRRPRGSRVAAGRRVDLARLRRQPLQHRPWRSGEHARRLEHRDARGQHARCGRPRPGRAAGAPATPRATTSTGATASATIAPSSPSTATTGGATSAPSAIAPTISAQKTPNTRAVTSGATARCSAVIASTSTTSVPAPRTTCAANATAGDSVTASTMFGQAVESIATGEHGGEPRRGGEPVDEGGGEQAAEREPGQQDAEPVRPEAEPLLGCGDVTDGVHPVDHARQHGEATSTATRARARDLAQPTSIWRSGPAVPPSRDVDRPAAHAHPRDQRRGGDVGRRVDANTDHAGSTARA